MNNESNQTSMTPPGLLHMLVRTSFQENSSILGQIQFQMKNVWPIICQQQTIWAIWLVLFQHQLQPSMWYIGAQLSMLKVPSLLNVESNSYIYIYKWYTLYVHIDYKIIKCSWFWQVEHKQLFWEDTNLRWYISTQRQTFQKSC